MLNADNNIPKVEEIDLSQIDWNKLSIREFHEIEQKLIANKKQIKRVKQIEKRVEKNEIRKSDTGDLKNIVVVIKGNKYTIKYQLYERLKNMKSEKSKESLINEIISTHNPIQDL